MEFNSKHRKLSKNKSFVRTPSSTKPRLTKKRTIVKKRKCVCLPENISVVEFPPIWNELRLNGQLCDGTIVCRDMKSIRVHRAILSAVSPYFKVLFINSLKKGDAEEKEIFVDVPSYYMGLILDYAYTGTCTVTSDNVQYLLPYGDQFDVVDMVTSVINIFKSKILQWQPVVEDEKCQEALYPAVVFLTVLDSRPETEADLNDPLARPRIPYEILFAVGGWSAGSPTSFVETYDTRADRWFLSIHMDLSPRAYHGLCALNNLIYMIGGFDGSDHFNTVRCYDPVTNTWLERACMYQARCYVSVVVHDGLIYALGGYNGRTRMASVERYHPDKNQWEMTTPMNKQRSDASAASLGGKIYIVGGFNGQEVLSSAEVFDPETKQWSFIRSMLSPRSGVSLIAYRDALYALGGFNGYSRLNTGERFCPQRGGEWQEVTEMFSARSNFATVLLDDMIFVIGGFNGSTTIPHVECYDGDTMEWYDAAPMNLTRSALSACVIAGLPNARAFSYLAKAVPAAGADQAHHS
ncbi:unnamed protein product [Colias eurytheme]|nr:unnamed protein product [Colias eurytheme]